jgi:hypothetical protein
MEYVTWLLLQVSCQVIEAAERDDEGAGAEDLQRSVMIVHA